MHRVLRPWARKPGAIVATEPMTEAIEMLNLLTTAPALSAPAWMVQLRAEFTAALRTAPDADECEPMVELMRRTGGVRSVAVVPLPRGLAVAVGLSAPDATTAVEQADPRRLVRALRGPRRARDTARASRCGT